MLDGRFGPYVTDGTVNASVPRGVDIASVTLDQAVELLRERAARGPAKKTAKRDARRRSRRPRRRAKRTGEEGAAPRSGRQGARGEAGAGEEAHDAAKKPAEEGHVG